MRSSFQLFAMKSADDLSSLCVDFETPAASLARLAMTSANGSSIASWLTKA